MDPEGAAAEAGVQAGNVILEVNGKAVGDIGSLTSALASATEDKPALLLINRRGYTCS